MHKDEETFDNILGAFPVTRTLVENSDDVTNSESEVVGSNADEEEHEVITVRASEESKETETETDNERRPPHEDERDEVNSVSSEMLTVEHADICF